MFSQRDNSDYQLSNSGLDKELYRIIMSCSTPLPHAVLHSSLIYDHSADHRCKSELPIYLVE